MDKETINTNLTDGNLRMAFRTVMKKQVDENCEVVYAALFDLARELKYTHLEATKMILNGSLNRADNKDV